MGSIDREGRLEEEGSRIERSLREARWPASLAVVFAIALYWLLPEKLIIGPRWLVPALESGLLIALTVVSPYRHGEESKILRALSILLIALIQIANAVTLAFLVRILLFSGTKASGVQLALSAIEIWLTNVVTFALWYWELDGGGPGRRLTKFPEGAEFLFPQMTSKKFGGGWKPSFVDYLFVSFTNSTAFSPTDTMPLTQFAKIGMMMQATLAVITVVLVAARAVNILG
jgi:hypothetical protein